MDYMKTEVDLPDPSCCRLTKYLHITASPTLRKLEQPLALIYFVDK